MSQDLLDCRPRKDWGSHQAVGDEDGRSAQADLIVSGDKRHVLALGSFQGIPIVTAAEAVKKIAA